MGVRVPPLPFLNEVTMIDLHVILRTCQRSKLNENLRTSDIPLARICGDDRELMILKCVSSLVNSINAANASVKLTVLDDHSDKKFLNKLKKIITKCINASIVSLDKKGFNNSAYQQFKLASETQGLVYTVEDDYIHEENAINDMIHAFIYFSQRFQDNVMIFPFDCPFRYEQGFEEPTVLFHDGNRYWRHVTKTTYTFLTHGETVKKHFKMFEKLALKYPSVLEDDTINTLYKKVIPSEQEDIIVFNPIPSLAYHLSYAEPVKIQSKQLTWKTLWEQTNDFIIE